MKMFKDAQILYNLNTGETDRILNSLIEINRITNPGDETDKSDESDSENDNESIVFSSESN